MTRSITRGFALALGLALGLGASAATPTTPPPARAPDLAALAARLGRAEYEVSFDEGSRRHQAPNRAQGFRSSFDARGPALGPRLADAPPWQVALAVERYGCAGAWQKPAPAEPAVRGERVVYHRGDLHEWYVNRAAGLEQGFIVWSDPCPDPAAHELAVVMAVSGTLEAALVGDRVQLRGAADHLPRLDYGDLIVRDALGQRLPSRLAVEDGAVAIHVDAARAVFPLLVDPNLTAAVWTIEKEGGTRLGKAVSSAGDVNGDGYDDVLVAAEAAPGEALPRVELYYGGPGGPDTTPDWFATDPDDAYGWGDVVATAGDVNKDGYADILIGSIESGIGGAVFAYYGSAGGLPAAPSWTYESPEWGAELGTSLASAGDVNNDGYSDIIVGAPHNAGGDVLVFHGSAAGLPASPNWIMHAASYGDRFGESVASANDVDGDGCADVIIGAPLADGSSSQGIAYVFLGTVLGLETTPAWTTSGTSSIDNAGRGIAAGDLDADGFSDVVVCDPGYSYLGNGRLRVFAGSAAGLSTTVLDFAWGTGCQQLYAAGDLNGDGYGDILSSRGGAAGYRAYFGSPDGLILGSSDAPAGYQRAVASAGDVNGDGYSDVIVGTPLTTWGGAHLRLGKGDTLGGYLDPYDVNLATAWQTDSDQAGAQYGLSVSGAGDVNGDGYEDLVVGAPYFDNGATDEGKVFAFYGSATGPGQIASWSVEGVTASTRLGHAVAGAGDLNGDGYTDVVVGTPYASNGQASEGRIYVYNGSSTGLGATASAIRESNQVGAALGWSVASAGDVNGDGYADLIVGVPYWDGGETNEGQARIYTGSAAGLGAAATWTTESNVTNALYGLSVAGAGDVNRDGFGEVLVGAPYHGNGEGAAYVYAGAAAGPSATPLWMHVGDYDQVQFGRAVSGAGDVNGDGYADILVGAPYHDNDVYLDAGRVDLFHGSPTGPSLIAAWQVTPTVAGLHYGTSVAAAGDVNGDGLGDLAIGQVNGCGVYLGAAASVPTLAWSCPSNDSGDGAGASLSAADVNGDGYADVMVGIPYDDEINQTNEGRVELFYGNGADGLVHSVPVTVQARRYSNTAPIPRHGKSDSSTAFRLRAFGRAPSGRSHIRLQGEVKPLDTPFDGTGLFTTTAVDTGTTGYTFNRLVSGLTAATSYHYRVRILYDPIETPFLHHSRWITPPAGGWNQAMLRTP